MRQILFILIILAGAVLSGCAKTDLVFVEGDSKEIVFDAPVPRVHTKADLVKDLYPENSTFCVFADQHWDTFLNTETEDFTPYMRGTDEGGEGVEVKHSGVSMTIGNEVFDHYWKPDRSYMWPKDGYLTFAAYSPAYVRDHAQISYTQEFGVGIENYTVDADADNHYDLMFSSRVTDRKKTDMETDLPSPYDGVQIVFEHVLSAIVFHVPADRNYTEWGSNVHMTNLSLHNVYSTADFRQFAGKENDEVDMAGMWTGYEGKREYVAFHADDDDSIMHDQDADLILLPQSLAEEGMEPVRMELQFEMSHPDMAGMKTHHSISFDLSQGKKADDTVVDRWEPGKRYVYTITIGLDTIEFSPDVYAWEDHQVPDLPPLDQIPFVTLKD